MDLFSEKKADTICHKIYTYIYMYMQFENNVVESFSLLYQLEIYPA